jgi:exodeoxyribonuclease V alpha subunit
MLGDIKQLESIGLGNLTKDMLESGVIKVVELTKIHRQAEASGIISESLKASRKEHLVEKDFEGRFIKGELQDMEYDIYKNKDMTVDRMLYHLKELLEKGIDMDDIQLIVPMKDRGIASAYNINNLVQDIVTNKKLNHVVIGKETKTKKKGKEKSKVRTIYVGDRIINMKNNYKILSAENKRIEVPIFNGDLGVVTSINNDGTINVKFNNKEEVIIPQTHLNEIQLGYCITTHKIQGSSAPYIICGLDYSHYSLLTKELVYTMLTRAKKYCILCAENEALRYAVKNSNIKKKQTFLCDLLMQANNNLEEFKKDIKPVIKRKETDEESFRFLEDDIIF